MITSKEDEIITFHDLQKENLVEKPKYTKGTANGTQNTEYHIVEELGEWN